jgi:hypothetical protein
VPSELIAWLVLGFLALVALHELTHVLIARFHGHPTVCIAINPVGVAVVFEDSPKARYWLAQVILPAIVSWLVCYVWLYGVFTYPTSLQMRVNQAELLTQLHWIVTLLTLLTSGGDIISGLVEVRKPVHGHARLHRDFAVLKKMPAIVLFTAHGRKHWRETWLAIKAGSLPGATPDAAAA